jgi:dipeptidyl aminopeptidase/acylaminoacyl peptidase
VTEQQTSRDFEDRFARAVRSYAAEGDVDFDPRRISAHARTAATVPGWWWRGRRATPVLAFRVVRVGLMVALLVAAATALTVVGSRLLAPHLPVPGLLAWGSGDQILVVDPLSGMSSHAITAKAPHDDYPVWSPDGTRLVISQHDGRGKLQLVDADGGNRHPVLGDLTSGIPAAWSPDGTRIAFSGYHYPGVAEPGLYVVDADGTDLTLLVPEAHASDAMTRLAWSPDGSLIAFVALTDENRPDGARGVVKVVEVVTGKVGPVSSSLVVTKVGAPLAWRPGRTELLYAQLSQEVGEAGHEDIVLAERVGNTWHERPVVSGFSGSNVTNPMWLDAGRFAYVRDNRLWVAHLDDVQPEVAIGPELTSNGPGCVSVDGSVVVVRVAGAPPTDEGTPSEDSFLLVPTDGGATSVAFTGYIDLYSPCSWQAVSR